MFRRSDWMARSAVWLRRGKGKEAREKRKGIKKKRY
jgi:hypothetical protein